MYLFLLWDLYFIGAACIGQEIHQVSRRQTQRTSSAGEKIQPAGRSSIEPGTNQNTALARLHQVIWMFFNYRNADPGIAEDEDAKERLAGLKSQ